MVFPDTHPHFKQNEKVKKAINETLGSILGGGNTQVSRNYAEYPNLPEAFEKVGFDEKTGGYMAKHKLHGKNEAAENIRIGRLLMSQKEGHRVMLLPNENKEPYLQLVGDWPAKVGKFADALVDGEVFDFKVTGSTKKQTIKSVIRKAKDQANNILIEILDTVPIGVFKDAANNRVNQSTNVEGFWVIRNKVLYKLTRNDVLRNKWPF